MICPSNTAVSPGQASSVASHDAIVLGAGAAGLFCAAQAGQRGRRVVLLDHADELDELLREYSEHWAVERMPALDRAVLRLGCFELTHERDVPTAVVISEAVELAKLYSTKDSGRFVNGLLSRIAEELRPATT